MGGPMDHPSSDFPEDERSQQQAPPGFPNPAMVYSKKMKLLIKILSVVLIILFLPFSTNHFLPLLRTMGISLLQRLWDALRFIAITAAIFVGIISTSQRKGLDKSDSNRRSHDHRRALRREPAIVNGSYQRAGKEVDNLHQWKGKEVNNLMQQRNGKEVVDQSANSSNYHSREAIFGSESPTIEFFSRIVPQEYEYFMPRKCVSSSRSASEAWFATAGFASKIDEEEEEAGVSSSGGETHGAHQGSSAESSKKASYGSIHEKQISRETMLDIHGARRTRDLTSVYTDYSTAVGRRLTSRLDLESENGKPRRRSSSLDRPIQRQQQDPGLKLLDADNKAIVKLSDRSIQVYNGDQHPLAKALQNRPTQQQSKLSLSSSKLGPVSINLPTQRQQQQQSIEANLQGGFEPVNPPQHPQSAKISSPNAEPDPDPIADNADVTMGSNQIVQKQHELKMVSTHFVQRQSDANMLGSNQILQKQADVKMGCSNQILQKQANAKMGSDDVQKQHDAKMSSAQIVQNDQQVADPTAGYNKGQFYRTSSSNRLMLSSKHSKSALNLDQLNVTSAKPPRSLRRKTSYSCDFGDDFNSEWLFEEPPPPPGLSESEAEDSNPVKATSKSTRSKANLAESLVPWRTSVPINISNPSISHPSPEETPSNTISPSPGEVNRRADEFINNFNNMLIRQKQESLERKQKRWSTTRGGQYY